MNMSVQDKGIVWFSDGNGQIFKGRLLDYDNKLGKFWAEASRECPGLVDIVVILKDGRNFPSGKVEWCGKTRLVSKERKDDTPEGFYLLCLETSA